MDQPQYSTQYAANDCTKKSTPLAEVQVRIGQALTAAEKEWDELAGRLKPIRNESPKPDCNAEKLAMIGNSPLLQSMMQTAARVEGLVRRIRFVSEEVEC
jgi:hypothetical protein